MKYLVLTLIFGIIFSCSKANDSSVKDLEIIFYNKEIFSYPKNINKDTINIIRYSLKNNTNQLYFINNITNSIDLQMFVPKKNGVNISIYDKKNVEVKYFQPTKCEFDSKSVDYALDYLESINIEEKRLGYVHPVEYFKNTQKDELFFIHPNEILFFECAVNINRPIKHNGNRLYYADLDSKKEYFAELKIASDSSNYKTVLPRNILQSITENKAKVYHGMIKSKNKIPIKVLE